MICAFFSFKGFNLSILFSIFRYGSDLASVESFRQNNFTADLAADFLAGQESNSYWLGLQAYNDLQTNTLAADAGHQISQYYGHWAQLHPDVEQGSCVKSVLRSDPDR